MKVIFDFNHKHLKPPMELKELLGGKGANLAEMASILDLPVPPGFTITTVVCRARLEGVLLPEFENELASAVFRLEQSMGKHLGDKDDPLLVSVRSGAQYSMPGMMDTVLNLGLNDKSVEGLCNQTGSRRFAFDSYRRFISMFARIVLGVNGALFDSVMERAEMECDLATDSDLSVKVLEGVVAEFKDIVLRATQRPFPQDPIDQLREAIDGVIRSWGGQRATDYRLREGIPNNLGTAVNVQSMVFGNLDDNSGTGVGFTRNPSTGEREAFGDFLATAQGEDVVAGLKITEPLDAIRERFPEIYAQLLQIFDRLEIHYRDMCDTEFTIQSGQLWMLQTRIGKRSGCGAIRMAVEMASEGDIGISRREAILRVSGDHLDQVLHPQFSSPHRDPDAKGLGASPGAAVGRCYFTAQTAVEATQRGEDVVLLRRETSPDDIHGIMAAQGILTARGGMVSHAAVVARGWGKPAVVGAECISIYSDHAELRGQRVNLGDWISIDGSSGDVFLDRMELVGSIAPKELSTLLEWADQIRAGKMGVRANAETYDDALLARSLGAEGIGLCRTEHMFLGDDRLPVLRRLILARDEREQRIALEELCRVQRADFYSILEAMDGLPVTVRLLDPPLHEFLPSTEELAVKEASVGLNEEERELLSAARAWQEVNPMMGTRGVRLGIVRPGLYEMQVKAFVEAALERIAQGGNPIIEVMIPLIVTRAELHHARQWIEDAMENDRVENNGKLKVKIGTMIETPRAALVAEQLATCVDFFSFGTNDLTQMTFGFSRDDVESRLMGSYLDLGLIDQNPFESIDVDGVGALVQMGVEGGRRGNHELSFGACGEHGGDPMSIGLFAKFGINYVSCSPYRVPIARLAAAQAMIGLEVA